MYDLLRKGKFNQSSLFIGYAKRLNGLTMYWLCWKIIAVIDNRKIIFTNFFYKIYFISVKGQSLDVNRDSVIGVLGESVNITWTLGKVDQTDKVVSTRLFLGNFTDNKLLYEGVSVLIKRNLAKEMFGERIQVFFKEPNYTLTLSNLSFNDAVTFTLVVNVEIQGTVTQRPAAVKSVAITEVRGMWLLELTSSFDPQQYETD